jgi:precorrin-6A/cobalt-precorrin-6A reductase
MSPAPLIAVLAGTRAARAATEWVRDAGVEGCVIWAGEATPEPLSLPRHGAVPAEATGILDATHPFDTQTRTAACAAAPRARYARIARALWTPQPQDKWQQLDEIEAAVAALPPGARVFAATGRASLPALARHDGPVFLRQLTPHDDPTGQPNCEYVFGSAPFTVAGEVALLQRLRIDLVLARNIGGSGSFPKLAAARELGLPVVLVRPPPAPDGPILGNAADVAQWIAGL